MSNILGHSIGRYHILEQLGEGGMAIVYKAYDTRLERDVAVKVIRRGAFPPDQLERILKRFEREAKALARLTHPNIVPVIDYGEHESAPYLVMPYLPGGTLKQRLKDLGKPLPWADALRLLLPIADSLNYAHQHNILHRDVKPSNILLTENGQPMLTDFGIAKILDVEDGQTLTGTGVGMGTPEYMSPEQGLGKPVDARTDVYSLGVVLYEMLTGRKPYTADTPMAVVLKQATEPLPRPTQFVKDLPEAVEKLLLKALAKDPADRYQSMAEFAAAMQAVISRQSLVEERPQTAVRRSIPPSEDAAATVDQGATGETVVEEDDRGPQTVDRPPSTVHRPSSIQEHPQRRGRSWLWAMTGLAIVAGLIGWGLWQQQVRQNQAAALQATSYALAEANTAQAEATTTAQTQITTTARAVQATATAQAVKQATAIAQAAQATATAQSWATATAQLQATATAQARIVRPENACNLNTLRTLEHTANVNSMAFSPDGQVLASGSDDGTVRLWRVSGGTLLHTLRAHTERVSSVAFSPDGQTLASGSKDNTIRLWRVSDGMLLHTLQGHTSPVLDVAFSPDGQTLASVDWNDTIQIWHFSDGTLINTLHGFSYLNSVIFSPDGQILVAGAWSWASPVQLWRVSNGGLLHTFGERGVTDMDFSPDGQILALVSDNGEIELRRFPSGSLLSTLGGVDSIVYSASFSPNSKILAAGYESGIVGLWSLTNGHLLCTLKEHTGAVNSVVFSPDGQTWDSGANDGSVRLWGVR